MEPLDQLGPGEDHYHAHEKRTHDAPEQNSMLILLGDLEVTEDQEEDKEVINGERKLDQVACEEQLCFIDSKLPVDERVKTECE